MATSAHVYTKFMKQLLAEGVDILGDNLKVMLLSAYIPGTTQDTAEFVSDVLAVASEASGTGYTAGGQVLTGVSVTEVGHVIEVSCTNPNWNTVTLSAAYALFFDATPGSNSTNPVICYWDFGGTDSPGGANLQLQINASGFVTLTGA